MPKAGLGVPPSPPADTDHLPSEPCSTVSINLMSFLKQLFQLLKTKWCMVISVEKVNCGTTSSISTLQPCWSVPGPRTLTSLSGCLVSSGLFLLQHPPVCLKTSLRPFFS